MMAKKKPIETLPSADFGITAPLLELLNIAEPPARKPGKILNSVAELVAALREEKVL